MSKPGYKHKILAFVSLGLAIGGSVLLFVFISYFMPRAKHRYSEIAVAVWGYSNERPSARYAWSLPGHAARGDASSLVWVLPKEWGITTRTFRVGEDPVIEVNYIILPSIESGWCVPTKRTIELRRIGMENLSDEQILELDRSVGEVLFHLPATSVHFQHLNRILTQGRDSLSFPIMAAWMANSAIVVVLCVFTVFLYRTFSILLNP